jgi:phage baseplate assembly protein gpV
MTTANLTLTDRIKPPIEQWKLALKQLSRDIRVAVPGIIKSFNADLQTAVVQVAITEKMNIWAADQNGAVSQTQQEKQIPLLGDVPVLLPRCAGFAITLPIQSGDECLLIFNDCMIDWFWQSGQVSSTNNHPRRHDLSDAVCIPTGISQQQVLAGYSANSLQVRSVDATTVVDVAEGQITVTAPTVNIMAANVNIAGTAGVTISGDLLTTIESRVFLAHTHSGVSSGGGISGPVV